jgi:4-hydroxybenzoate polyprenyltransferase
MPAYRAEFASTHIFPDHLLRIPFLLLVFATVIIAAGGNIINDVFDVSIDETNKPGKNLVGKKISEKTALNVAYLFFIPGSIVGISLGIMYNMTAIGFLFPFSAATLYMYSASFKRKLLIGNILIAFLAALTILIVGIFEPHYFVSTSIWLRGTMLTGDVSMDSLYLAGWKIILFYSLFAFLISLVRELIKDAEDLDGDERAQRKTFPVRFGIRNTKILISILIITTCLLLSYLLYENLSGNSSVNILYLIIMVSIPFAALLYLVITASEKKDFYYASMFSKIIMLCGILSMIPFYYYFLR